MVSHAHDMPAKDAPACQICKDVGLWVFVRVDGGPEYRVCGCPAGKGKQAECDEANASLRRLEERTKKA